MASFASRLARISSSPSSNPMEGLAGQPPSLDILRERIAAIVARRSCELSPPESTRSQDTALPFVAEQVKAGAITGEVHLARKRAPLGARIGVASLADGALASPAVLALLALDPAIAPCDVKRALFLDVESTGLSGGAGNIPFLIGLSRFEEGCGTFVLEQLLLRRLGEDAPMLGYLRDRMEEASMIVTFNGKSFDLPLLRSRAVLCRVGSLPQRPHLDLLHVGRRLHAHRLQSCSLKAIERDVLGLERVGDVGGAEIGAIYGHYLRTGDEYALAGVVEHNAVDVFSMVALVGFYGEPIERYFRPGARSDRVTDALHPADIGALARILRRVGRLDEALVMANYAVLRGGGTGALQTRAEVARARGECAAALADFEALLQSDEALQLETDLEANDRRKSKRRRQWQGIRLSLAKLYEHHACDFRRALEVVAVGTGERASLVNRRRTRLEAKLEKKL